ncbi:MAG TPA: hypothetical protein VGZ91_10250 [Candidatus Sulfotelmatobacter sp.]|jgi:hypothetical protein|nr:hypothetical protein [Candidatus Sulfotelmatobacter sp.]
MERPASVTVIAALFFLVAGYLIATGVAEFVYPGSLSMARGMGITYGRELSGPQAALSVGAGWALVGWGIYRLQNWARWCAIVLMVLGVAGSVPAVSAAARDITWRFFIYGAQIMVRIVIAWLLAASPELINAFGRK